MPRTGEVREGIVASNQYALTRQWAAFYEDCGYQPLPSRRKRPLLRYADFWEERFAESPWRRIGADSIQIMCGAAWRLCAIDLDGPEAVEYFATLGPVPATWTVLSPGGGRHLWFTLPSRFPRRGHSLLWGIWDDAANDGKGDWRNHVAIELFADRSLITAPPSRHPNGGRYQFAAGRSPNDIERPAPVPEWLWTMPAVRRPNQPAEIRLPAAPRVDRGYSDRYIDARTLAEMVPAGEKVAMARDWGLRFADKPRQVGGWVSVHDFNREDRKPSARFNVVTGEFWRPREPTLGFFNLAVALGAYRSFVDAKMDIYKRYA